MASAAAGDKVFFAGGGEQYEENHTDQIEIFDVSTNTLSYMDLLERKTDICASCVGNEVLFAGGFAVQGYAPAYNSNLIEIYDTLSNSWTYDTLPEPSVFSSAVSLYGKVYLTKSRGQNLPASVYIFDQGTNTISTTHLEYLKGGLVSSALDEHIYWSGTDCGVEIQNVNTQINNIQNKFKPLLVSRWPNMVIKDKKICFFRPEEQEFDIFNTVDKTWSIGTMPKPLPVWASVIVLNNEIYVAGGIIHGKSSSLVYKVDF